MLPWQLFANAMTHSSNSLIANQRLITKVYFPRLIIPLSAVLSALADFAIAFLAMIVLMIWHGLTPTPKILALPIFILLAIAASLAVGLWLAALSAIYRDFRYTVPFIVQVGLFISPVIYTTESVVTRLPHWAAVLYGLNPMVCVIAGFRWALLGTNHPPGLLLITSISMTVVLLIAGAYYFRHMEQTFADVI